MSSRGVCRKSRTQRFASLCSVEDRIRNDSGYTAIVWDEDLEGGIRFGNEGCEIPLGYRRIGEVGQRFLGNLERVILQL